MTGEAFESLLNRRIDAIRRTLGYKAREYGTEDERLHNFIEAAKFMRNHPATSCLHNMTKHLVSIVDMVRQAEKGNPPSWAMMDEKIGDAINYLILLEAILKNRDGA